MCEGGEGTMWVVGEGWWVSTRTNRQMNSRGMNALGKQKQTHLVVARESEQ